MQSRVSQSVSNFRFFNIFIIMHAHWRPKTPKTSKFSRILAKIATKIEWCANFLRCTVSKLFKIKCQFFAVRFLCPSSAKHKYTVPLKNLLFLNYYTSKSLFLLFWKCVKNAPKHFVFKVVNPLQKITSWFFFLLQNKTSLFFRRSKLNSHLAKRTFHL